MKAGIKKKAAVLLLVLSFALTAFFGLKSAAAVTEASGLTGDGSVANPYQISTAAELYSLRGFVGPSYRGKNFKLMNNISLKAYQQWDPIGTGSNAATAFQGNFDGNGFSVSDIQIERLNVEYQGLFGSIYYGTVRNLGLASGTIIGGNITGGIVAYLNNGNIVDCYNKASVGIQRIWNDPGGIAGVATNYSQIEGCYNAGGINGEIAGGIVGTLSAWSGVRNCYNTGVITGLTNDTWTPNNRLSVGGIIGYMSQSSISHCYNTGKIERYSDKTFEMGALVGYIYDMNHSALGAGLYYDKETSGVEYGIYNTNTGVNAKDASGARTSSQMLQKSTYSAFDFTQTWYMWDGVHMPMLRSMAGKGGQKELSYTVTFDGDGGTYVGGGAEVQTVYAGQSVTALPNYRLEGHAKNGWDGSYTNVNSDRTVKQIWKQNAYNVIFVLNGGQRTGGGELEQAVIHGGDASEPIVQRDGYTFLGWDKSFRFVTETVTVTALWVQGGYFYEFNPNGGILSGPGTGYLQAGEELTGYPTVTRAGYTFLGWEREFFSAERKLYLTAIWAKNPTVTFELNGGYQAGGGALEQTLAYGGDAVLPNAERTGYDLGGWDKSNLRVLTDTTITAQWNVKTFTVTFNGGGGTFISGKTTQRIEYGKSAVAPVFQKSGGTFAGWDIDFNEVVKDITVTAQWNSIFYEVTFDGNGGTLVDNGVNPKQMVAYDETATAPAFTREGYTFAGWDKPIENIRETTTIKANWDLILDQVKYTVTFVGNGGKTSAGMTSIEVVVEHGKAASAPVFTKDGYTLSWDKSFSKITENLTVTAQWEINQYTVRFNGNGGKTAAGVTSVDILVEHGQAAPAPAFIKEGYTLSWDAAFSVITSDMTVTAQWAINQYTVTFEGNGGKTDSGITTVYVTVEYGKAADAPNFTRAGYALSWNKTFSRITADTTVTARWAFITPSPSVTVETSGTEKTLTASGFEEEGDASYSYQWQKKNPDGTWENIPGETGKSIQIGAGENHENYRVLVSVTDGDGATHSVDSGSNYTDRNGNSLAGGTGTGSGGSGGDAGLNSLQKIIITVAIIVGILILLLIIILIAKSIAKEKRKQQQSYRWY